MSERLLQRLYSNPKYGVAFQSVDKIYKKALEFNKDVTRQEVDDFIRSKSSYSIFSRKRTNFPRRRIFSLNAGKSLSVDLMQLSKEERNANRPFTFIYVQIDIFSGYGKNLTKIAEKVQIEVREKNIFTPSLIFLFIGNFFPLKNKGIDEIQDYRGTWARCRL